MIQAGCCCGAACSCPTGTELPSTVSLTLSITGCQGTTAVLQCVLQLNENAPCGVGVCLCGTYSFTANLTTPGGCAGNFACDMPYDVFDTCQYGHPGEALIGLSAVGLGTNGRGFDWGPYEFCDIWVLRFRLSIRFGTDFPAAQSATGECNPCVWHNPELPCMSFSQEFNIVFYKPSGKTPIGTYISTAGSILDSCTEDLPPSCEPCTGYWGMIINSVTIA